MSPLHKDLNNLSKPKALWHPSGRYISEDSNIKCFMRSVNEDFNLAIESYKELYDWSIENYSDFWSHWWKRGGFISSHPPSQTVTEHKSIAELPRWFVGARLNFAENLLRFRDESPAIIALSEGVTTPFRQTYRELYESSQQWARALRRAGVKEGTRVAGYLPNGCAAVHAMLGATTLGGVWCSASPDFGVTGVLDRLQQVQPEVLVSVEAVIYNGKVHDHLDKLRRVAASLPSLKLVIVVPFVHPAGEVDISNVPHAVLSEDFLTSVTTDEVVSFAQVAFDAPLFIMFSSGTTGAPKCIVHGVGGTLIQITKEHQLHCDLRRDDVVTYYTTTGWMMWQWLVTALHSGCSVLLYDGSPLLPHPATLFDLVDAYGITVLGTGAKWLAVLESKGVAPVTTHDLGSLRCILSTGSPLTEASYSYVYTSVKQDLLLGSISGGTDIISCFMGSCGLLPVYPGEVQCPLLGMAIQVWGSEGQRVWDEAGELVCTQPFPSMPTHFWGDVGHAAYTRAYFTRYPGVWTQGDYCVQSSHTHGLVMLGRSDGVLNPCGVRFGSAEIYAVVEGFVEVEDSVCVGQRRARDGEERVVLFLKLRQQQQEEQLPQQQLSADLKKKIASAIRERLSARHVPAVMLPVACTSTCLTCRAGSDLYRDLPDLQGWQ
ncbi:acetoacetyl-CoA synthetase [Hyalella azteca]|uniref:Acetoacetyl-CoA synthetase n=1 Tax=Hyalella azteca TaxID=294128 RepID=A0A979FQP6_HYAAZ|nr:acetoacetyl-CoA synthetase [Hyalella azteca]